MTVLSLAVSSLSAARFPRCLSDLTEPGFEECRDRLPCFLRRVTSGLESSPADECDCEDEDECDEAEEEEEEDPEADSEADEDGFRAAFFERVPMRCCFLFLPRFWSPDTPEFAFASALPPEEDEDEDASKRARSIEYRRNAAAAVPDTPRSHKIAQPASRFAGCETQASELLENAPNTRWLLEAEESSLSR
jgi:hypothetical protein